MTFSCHFKWTNEKRIRGGGNNKKSRISFSFYPKPFGKKWKRNSGKLAISLPFNSSGITWSGYKKGKVKDLFFFDSLYCSFVVQKPESNPNAISPRPKWKEIAFFHSFEWMLERACVYFKIHLFFNLSCSSEISRFMYPLDNS